ncbi:flagellar export chaperone FliS [Clostridium tunisiense]|uniref:flagellar export chaperone FliS n=1 Tax=Clostridium tunisiense TaxID=219748 RepID=UPI0003007A12|nr:flagellar export chaperone FliS [Clostridium tunisiense]
MYGNNAYNVYKNNSINFASKEQLLLMLLDGSVKFAKIARQAILDKDIMKAHENIVKTQNIYYELMTSLDVNQGGEWAKNLMGIYTFIIDKLVQANIKKDVNTIDEVMPLIEDVRDTWNEAYKISKRNK